MGASKIKLYSSDKWNKSHYQINTVVYNTVHSVQLQLRGIQGGESAFIFNTSHKWKEWVHLYCNLI